MKKKVLAVVMGVLFVADVVMTLFNFDIFSRFIKEKRKETNARIQFNRATARARASFPGYSYSARGTAYYNDTNNNAKWKSWRKEEN